MIKLKDLMNEGKLPSKIQDLVNNYNTAIETGSEYADEYLVDIAKAVKPIVDKFFKSAGASKQKSRSWGSARGGRDFSVTGDYKITAKRGYGGDIDVYMRKSNFDDYKDDLAEYLNNYFKINAKRNEWFSDSLINVREIFEKYFGLAKRKSMWD